MSVPGLRRSLPAAVALSLVTASGASAATVEPLLDTSVIDRLHQMVPLGPSGSTIAINAGSAENGKQVGPNQFLVRNGIYFAAADGTGLRRVFAAPEGEGLSKLRATGDGSRIIFMTEGLGADLRVMDTATEKVKRVGGGLAQYGTVIVAGPDRFFAVDYARLRAISSTGRALRVPGAQRSDTLAVSESETQVGTCGFVVRRGKAVALRLGVLDTTAGAVRTSRTTIAPHRFGDGPSCAVSDGGATVAALGGRHVYARRAGKVRKVRVPAGITQVASVSPDGRYVLAGGGPDHSGRGFVDVQRKLAIADLQTGRVATVRSLAPWVKRGGRGDVAAVQGRVAWAPDGSRVALTPTSGGVLIVGTADAAVRFVRSPAAPVGFRFREKQARVRGFTDDGTQVIFTINDATEDVTVDHPYAVGVGGGMPRYLLSDSMRSFQDVVKAADGSTTWVLPSSTCHSVYPQTLLRLVGGSLWDGPFESTVDPFA